MCSFGDFGGVTAVGDGFGGLADEFYFSGEIDGANVGAFWGVGDLLGTSGFDFSLFMTIGLFF